MAYQADPTMVEATVHMKVGTFFGKIVGLHDVKVKRRAVAEQSQGVNDVAIHAHDTNCGNDALVLNGKNMDIDGVVESNGFFEVGDGIFGEVLARAENMEDAGGLEVEGDEKVELGLELLREVVDGLSPGAWHVDADGEDLPGEYLAVEVMNLGQLGPNLPLAPDADPGDGLLDLVGVREEDRATLVSYLSERLRGLEPEPVRLPRHRGERVVLEPSAEVLLHADDRSWPEGSDGSRGGRAIVTLGPVLSVLVPRS